jgi:hypothetical protein
MTADGSSIEVEVVSSGALAGPHRRGSGNAEFAAEAAAMTVREFAQISSDDLRDGIVNVCAAVLKAMEQAAPESCDIEFSMGFKAGVKIPVLVSGEANAALKVTLRWKRAA